MNKRGGLRDKKILAVISLLVICLLPIALAASNSDNSFLGFLRNLFSEDSLTGNAVVTPVPTGTVGLWYLDENAGTTATDSSGNSNTGTLVNGPTWTTGISGSAINLDGINDYVSLPASSSFSFTDGTNDNPMTAEFWIYKKDASFSTWKYVMSAGVVSRGVWEAFFNPVGLFIFQINGFSSNWIGKSISQTNIPQNQWTHVVITYDGSKTENGIKIYLNGNLQTMASASNGAYVGRPADNYPLVIGTRYNFDSTGNINANIDEPAIYNRALSAAEVLQNYQAGVPPAVCPTGAVSIWKLDETSGITAADSVDSNPGNLINGGTWTTGKIGNALQLDGTNDYLDLDLLANDVGTQGTISVWAYVNSASNLPVLIGQSAGSGYIQLSGTNQVYTALCGLAGWRTVPTSFLNSWHLFTVACDSTGSTIYYDGTPIASGSGSAPFSPNVHISLGTFRTNDYFLNGKIDQAAYYNRKLTQTEVSNLYNSGNGLNCPSGVTVVCGNSIVEGTEQCDDGNTVTEACTYGQTSCTVCSATCQNVAGATSRCGDSIVQSANGETCDDGNLIAGDGCSSTCTIEASSCNTASFINEAASSNGGSIVAAVTNSYCGMTGGYSPNTLINGIIASNDWDCAGTPPPYWAVIDLGAQKTVSGFAVNHSSSYYLAVYGVKDVKFYTSPDSNPSTAIFTVATTGTVAQTNTGTRFNLASPISNVRLVKYEVLNRQDGANPDIVTGEVEVYAGDCVAGPVCGNSVVEGTEQCDDGNVVAGDGCSSTCTIEASSCPTGVVSSWKGNGDALDSVGPNPGTIVGTVNYVAGKQGQAFNITTTASYVNIGNMTGLDSQVFSVSLWWDARNIPGWAGPMAIRQPGKRGFALVNNGGSSMYVPLLVIYDQTNTEVARFAAPSVAITPPFNGFKHMVWTYDGTTAKFYLNGTSIPVGTGVSGWSAVANGGKIGMAYSGTTGAIDEVQYYNRALSAAEVSILNAYGNTGVCAASSSICGNSIIEGTEQCDDGNTVTEACTYGQTSCTVCSATCQNVAGATSRCGDSIVQSANGETCDDGNTNGGDGCSATCTIEAATPVCGNNIVEGTEVCDGSALNGQTCVTQGYASGTLSCNVGCTAFVTTSCVSGSGSLPACVGGDVNDDGTTNVLDAIIVQKKGVSMPVTEANRAIRCEGRKITVN